MVSVGSILFEIGLTTRQMRHHPVVCFLFAISSRGAASRRMYAG